MGQPAVGKADSAIGGRHRGTHGENSCSILEWGKVSLTRCQPDGSQRGAAKTARHTFQLVRRLCSIDARLAVTHFDTYIALSQEDIEPGPLGQLDVVATR